jgi:predicted nucleic acid-binding protein
MAPRIIIDTNVFVSALLGPHGASRLLLRACLLGGYQPLMGTTISLNRLREELATIALTELDAETRFRARAARASVAEGLRLLDKLDGADEASGD